MADTMGEKIFYVINYIFLTLIVVMMVLPFINVIAVSLSSEHAVISGLVYFWPVEFTVSTYEKVFKGSMLIQSLKNTILLTVVGTAINMVMTILAAYPLSKSRLSGRSGILMFITFTMLVNAGIIPNFILIKQLHLLNSYWAIWLGGALSTYNLIVMKTFFQSIPQSLEESAYIDGASDFRILLSIVLPLSLPAIATIALFYAVGHWNSYFSVMMYITSSAKATLQIRLRDLLNATAMEAIRNMMNNYDNEVVAEESIKAASIVIATVPILLVYPFLQRYFIKGVMIGSIKE